MIKSWMKAKKERNYGNKEFFYIIESLSKRWFRNGIHSWLRRDDARGNAGIIYRM